MKPKPAIALQRYRSGTPLTRLAAVAKGAILGIAILVFALTMNTLQLDAQTLHSFSGGTDGALPVGALVQGANGVLYGTTEYGGISPTCAGCGTIFQLTPPASPSGAWTESVIYAFPSGKYAPAQCVLARPTLGPNGEFYGTTVCGGAGVGDVYEVIPPSTPGGTWTGIILYTFSSAVGPPQNPQGGLVIGKNGVLYGTVQFSGTSPNCPYGTISYGCGEVFSLTPPTSPTGSWSYQTLHTFQGGSDGAAPQTDLVIGDHGELYGATPVGGPGSLCTRDNIPSLLFSPQSTGCGTVFELDPPSYPGGVWTETVIYGFQGGRDGGFPNAVTYHDGELFGTVSIGGDLKNCGGVGCGGVYRLSPPSVPGDPWTQQTIYNFTGRLDGLFPGAGVVVGKDGVLYGTTRDGGDKNSCPSDPGCGVVFQLSRSQDSDQEWSQQVLHRFASTDGWRPISGLVIGEDGDLYGTTYQGGSSANCPLGCGVAFQVQTQVARREQ